MTKSDKFDLIVNQIFIGLGVALLGAAIVSFLIFLIYSWKNTNGSLFGDIMYGLIGGFVGMLAGVWYPGYLLLKKEGRQKQTLKFALQSLLGLAIGLLIFYLTTGLMETLQFPSGLVYSFVNFLIILLPLVGLILGFNFNITKVKKLEE